MSLSSLVPMASVKSVPRSIAFYTKLGFVEGDSHTIGGASEPNWAWLRSGGAQLITHRAASSGSSIPTATF